MLARLLGPCCAHRMLGWALLLLLLAAPVHADVTGSIVDPDGLPIEGVRVGAMDPAVRVVNEERVVTDEDGRFLLRVDIASADLLLTFGRPEYVATARIVPQGGSITLEMQPLVVSSSPGASWTPPEENPDDPDALYCGLCHEDQVTEWRESRHSIAATDPLVLDMYAGTGAGGETVPPGYRLDNPDDPGPCANCHVAALAVDAPDETDLRDAEGVFAEGVFCAVCHQVREVHPGEAPGVAGSVWLWKPPASWSLFAFGPYDDVVGMPMRDVYSPLHRSARLCAGCHEYTNAQGVGVMTTYSEWSELVRMDVVTPCQDCHMKPITGEGPGRDSTVSDPDQRRMHGFERSPEDLWPHRFAGTTPEYLQAALGLWLEARPGIGEVEVDTRVMNAGSGHAVPTGMPMRNVMLLVTATDEDGTRLELVDGPVLPDWAGTGEGERHWAGQPGRGFKRTLGDESGEGEVPFWRATRVIEDTRVPPTGTVDDTFRFAATSPGRVTLEAKLVYRRAPIELAEAKGWEIEDGEMVSSTAEATVEEMPESDEWKKSGCGCRAAGDGGAARWLLPLAALALGRIRRRR